MQWLNTDLRRQFSNRLLAFDDEAALIGGRLMGEADRQGRPRAVVDAQIAAIALHHGLILATRNVSDFEGLGIKVENPWAR